MRRAAVVIGGIFALAFLFTVPALAQSYPPQEPTVEASSATVCPGGQVLLTGDNWEAGSTVTLDLATPVVSLGQATVRANGSFSKSVTIPSSTSVGPHTIEARGTDANGGSAVARGTLTLVCVAAGGGTSLTGANISPALLLMFALMIGGFVALFAARRRATASRRVEAKP